MKKILLLISVLFSSFLLASCGGGSSGGSADTVAPATPSNLTATASSEAIYLSWTGSEGATYKVYQSTASIGDDLSGHISYDVVETSTEITGLMNGTSYYFVVTALANGQESSVSNEVSGLPEFPLPSTPTNLRASASSGTVNLSWDSVVGATYKVYQSTGTIITNDLSSYSSYNVTESSTKITGLTNNITYYFVVTALANGKESPASNEVSALPDSPIPPAPTSLEVMNASGTVNLSWNSVAGATYKVYQSTASIGDDLSGHISYDVAETSTKITGLTNGTSYYFVVTALANGQESLASNEIIGLPDFPIPSSPTSLTVTSASSGTVNLSWNSVAGATYKVYQSTASIGDDLSGHISYDIAETTSTEITGLTNNTSYYFVVTALVNGKESAASNEVNGLPEFPIPSTPTNLRATPSSGTVNLSWTGSAGVHYYKVYQSSRSIGDEIGDDLLSSYQSYEANTNSRSITGLTNNTSYYFVVTAVIGDKESGASNEASGLPEFPLPSTPTELSVTPSSGTVNLSWTGSDGVHYYKVYQSTVTPVTPLSDDLSTYTSYKVTVSLKEISGLTNGTSYYFVVTAVIGDKESGASNEVSGLPEENLIAPPTNLMVIASSGTANLNWTGREGATYRVHQATSSFFGVAVANYETLADYTSDHVTATSTEITGLTNGASYYFVVTALIGDKESGASNQVIGNPDFPIPSAPTSLTVTSASSGTVNLSWNGVAGATYKVYQAIKRFGDDLSDQISYDITETSTKITGLTNGTRYYFVVTALENGKESPTSNEVDGLPDFPIPSTPTNLMASASSGTVNLSWTGSDGVHYYKIYQSTGPIISDDLSNYQLYETTTSSREITGLTNGTSYYFVVTAVIGDKESGVSNEASGLPDFPLPSTPRSLTVTSAGNGAVNLSWIGSDGAYYYKVYQSTATIISDDLSSYQSYKTTTSSREITGLTNGTSYYFVVTAVIGDKESGASIEIIGLPDFAIPATPTSLMVTNVSSGTVNLSWIGSDGTNYKVHQATQTFNNVLDYEAIASYRLTKVTTTSREITGLTNGTIYYFVVTAVIGDKESGASNEISELPDFPIPSTPTNLRATPSSGTVNLSWTGSAGVHYYKVYQSTGSIGDEIGDDLLSSYQSYEATTNSRAITGLTNNTSYYFVVTAVIGDKESGASNEASGLPEFPLPSTPTSLTVMNASGTVNLSWTGSDGATYKVHQAGDSFDGVADYENIAGYTSHNVSTSSIEITELTNGTSYYFVVTAAIGDKESGASIEIIGFPDFPIPPAPTSLTVTSASSGTVSLSWNGVAGATYKVYQAIERFGDDLSDQISYDVTETSTKITGLTNNTTYYFVVTALANGKESRVSNEASGLPEFPLPSTPTNLTVTGDSSGTVNLSWTGSEGVHYYKVYQSTGTIIATDLSSYTSYNVTASTKEILGLTNNTTYYFVVTAVIGDKESPASNEVIGFPEFPQPSTPTNLSATPSSGTVNLSWTGSAGAHYYKVYQSTATIVAADLSSYSSYNVAASSTEIRGLANGTTYYFVVIAVIGDKESGISNEVSGLPEENLIAPPTNLMVTTGNGTVALNWNSVAEATYRVHQSTSSFVGVADYENLPGYKLTEVRTTSIDIRGLTNGTRYYFVVTALVGDKESGASNEVIGNPDFPIPSTPTNLEVTDSSGAVSLSWDIVAGASYKVYQSTTSIANDLSAHISYDVTETSTKITRLTNGIRYYFVVTALANGKESPASDEIIGLPDFPIPSSPTGLVVTSASSGTVNLSWNSVAGATYKVYQSTRSIGDDLSAYIFRNATTSSTEISGLRNGTSYYFVVTSLANGKESPASDEVNGFPDFPTPSTPTGLEVTSVSSGTVNLRWNSVAGSYNVYQSTVTSFRDDLSSYTSYNVTARSIGITNLTNGTTYYFVVTALANGKESLASDEVDGLPDFPIPSTPTGLEVTNVSSGTVNLSWNSVAGATSYKVYQSTVTSFSDDLAGYTSTHVMTTSTEITDLRNGTAYYFVITALANGKESLASDEVSGLPDFPIPSTPTNLIASASSGTVNLSWNSVAGASYKVYQSTASIGDDLSGHISYDVAETSTEITDLRNGTAYYFVVTALANGKESPASDEVIGLPDFPIPSTPTNLIASASSGTVNLSWTGSAGAYYYKLYQSTVTLFNDDLSSQQSYNITETSTKITGLTNNTTYYFVVTAVIGDKESGISNEASGLPEFPQPSTPTNLSATPSSGTVNLSWTGSDGAHYYKVYQSTVTPFNDDLSSYTSYNVTASSKEISGLANGITYYFVVIAVIGDKKSGISNEVSGLPEENLIAPPTNLMVTANSSGTVNLSWTGRDRATYRVHQAEGTFGILAVADYTTLTGYTSAHVTETSTKITGLINGDDYYFVVTALVGSKESGASNEVIGYPDFPIPSTPTNLIVSSASSASSGTVNLSWDSVAGATYKVYQSTASIANDLSAYISYETTTSSREIIGLTNGTRYYFVVTALANGKESPASNEVDGLPDFPIPATPTGLVVTSVSSGTVNLRWNSVAGATYKVYQSTASIANDLSAYISYDVAETSREITGLTNGTRYYFVVTALANGKESLPSDEVDGLPDFPVPSTPTNLTVTGDSSGTVNLSWTGSIGAYYYKVYQSTATIISDDLSSYQWYETTTSSIEITGLTNGTSYYFVVTAVIGDKESAASDEVNGLPDFPIPSTPTGLEVTSVNNGTVNLNWTGSDGAHYYKVYQSTGTIITNDLSNYISHKATTSSIEITGLTNNTRYYFVVAAVIGDKESGISNEVSGIPDFPIPETPMNLRAIASSGTVNLSWDSVAGASYNVYQAREQIDDDDLSSYPFYNVTTNSREIRGLTNRETYYFVVTALANGKESPASDEVRGTPYYPRPPVPTNLTTSASSGTVNLSWNHIAGATYRVHQAEKSFVGLSNILYETLAGYTSTHVTVNSTEITDLTNGRSYYFVVVALANGRTSRASGEVIGYPDFPIPSTPTVFIVTGVSSGTVNLSWNSVAGATYKVYQKVYQSSEPIDDDLSNYISYNVTTTSIKISGLTNNTNYYFVVTALANGKESLPSYGVIGLPEFPIPSSPTSLTVTSASSGTVSLSWDSVAGARSYKVYQSSESIGDDLAGYTSVHVTTTSTEITELTNGESYYFVVTALIGDKESAASNQVIGYPDFPIPSTPTGLMVTGVSSGTVNLNWNSVAGATYRVYQATATIGDDLSSYTSYNVSTTSTEITELTNGTSYYFVVTALANGKESPASNQVIGYPDFPIPSTPTGLMVTGVSSGTVNLSWNSVAGASYKVYQSIATIGDDLSSYTSYDVSTTSTEITELTNGTSYYFVVTALANGKESPASDEVSGIPDFPIPATPTSLTVTSASSGTVNLSWTGSAGVHYYKVYQSTGSIGDDLLSSYQSYEATTNSRAITGLTNNTSYYFVVTAVIGDKESGISNGASGLPEFPQPSTPTELRATPSSGTVNLSWTGSVGAHYYKVYQSTGTIGDDLSSYTSYNVTASTKEITGLANGTTYYFVVIAVIADKESGISDEVSGLPEENLIAPPTNLEVTASSGTVNLNWTGRARATYTVHQAASSFFGVAVANYETLADYTSDHVTATSTEITELMNGASYYFVVTALIGDKESGASNQVIGKPDFPIPPAPTSLTVTSISSGTVSLSWNSVAGATSYEIHQSTEPFGSISRLNYGILSAYQSTEVNTTSSKITGLRNHISYYFVITALANGKESVASDEIIETPIAPRLNDTGITWGGYGGVLDGLVYVETGGIRVGYYFENQSETDCDPAGFATGTEQDCHQGQDAETTKMLTKIGDGQAGFDFTKLSSTGIVLSIQNSAWSDSGSESLGTKWSCVRDNVTGAVWEVKTKDAGIHNRNNTYTHGNWAALVEGSNTAKLCGYNDWRVPTIVELDSLVNLGHKSGRFLDTDYFPNTKAGAGAFWTSSPLAENSSNAWVFNFNNGEDSNSSKNNSRLVRLIHSKFTAINSWSDSRYIDHGDGTVTDNVTGLMWAKCPLGQSGTDCSGNATKNDWKEILNRVSASNLATYDDWRVPNRKELRTLVAYDRFAPSINTNLFPNTADGFWTSSPADEINNRGIDDFKTWLLNFHDGRDERYIRFLRNGEASSKPVRPVRSGR